MWFNPAGFNPDEGLLVAGAQTLARDPVFWRAVDGSTAGPLDFYALLWVKLAGVGLSFATARITGLLMVWGTLVFSHRLLRIFLSPAPARLALVPAALFFACATQDDFVHYSTEHLPLLLFAVSVCLLVGRQSAGACGRAAWWIGGIGLGLLPWAKLQSVPLGIATVGWLLCAIWTDPALPLEEKRRRLADLVLAGIAPTVLFLTLVVACGVWPLFLQGYVRQNFQYVVTDNTLAYLWQTVSRALNPTWHFQACIIGPLLVALAGSFLHRPLRLSFRGLWSLGLALFIAALVAVITPRRPFAHYLLFVIPPLLFWSGAIVGAAWNRLAQWGARGMLAAAFLVAGGALPLVVRLRGPVPEMVDQLQASRDRPLTAVGTIVRAYARPGDRLGVWGWMCDFYVETGLPQATRQASSGLCIQESPLLNYYRGLYLADLKGSRPALFVDAVGPTADFFEDRATQSHLIFPELAAYIRANYTEIIDLAYARVYVRNDRFAEVPMAPGRLQALADSGHRVRGQVDPEPVDIAQPHLPQNVIGGHVVRMMLPRAEMSWVLRGTERECYLQCGYDPRAYLEGDGDGTLFTVEVSTPSGSTYPIHQRLLDPVHVQSDRGLVHLHFPLPPVPAGSKLTVKTSPGPAEDDRWDWAYLAGVAFDHSPLYSYRQFPGFNRLPDEIAADVTYLEKVEQVAALALHAPADLRFRLHGGERAIAFDFGFRTGAYLDGGNTDGAIYRVVLRRPGRADEAVFERRLQPVGQPADRGNQHGEVSLPVDTAAGDELMVAIETGPLNNPAWDWTYLANLRIE